MSDFSHDELLLHQLALGKVFEARADRAMKLFLAVDQSLSRVMAMRLAFGVCLGDVIEAAGHNPDWATAWLTYRRTSVEADKLDPAEAEVAKFINRAAEGLHLVEDTQDAILDALISHLGWPPGHTP